MHYPSERVTVTLTVALNAELDGLADGPYWCWPQSVRALLRSRPNEDIGWTDVEITLDPSEQRYMSNRYDDSIEESIGTGYDGPWPGASSALADMLTDATGSWDRHLIARWERDHKP